MSAGEVIHTAPTGGRKAGNNTRLSLLPAVELLEVAELYGKGAAKYADHNWTRGYAWSLSYDALQRHLGAFWSGEEIDDGEGGTGLQHLACAAFHVLTLMYYSKHHRTLDDRHIAPPQPVGTIESGLIAPTLDGWIVTLPVGSPTFHWTLKLDTLRVGTEGLWQSEKTDLVYWFLESEWWVMDPANTAEDPWALSWFADRDVPAAAGPFVSYVAPQED